MLSYLTSVSVEASSSLAFGSVSRISLSNEWMHELEINMCANECLMSMVWVWKMHICKTIITPSLYHEKSVFNKWGTYFQFYNKSASNKWGNLYSHFTFANFKGQQYSNKTIVTWIATLITIRLFSKGKKSTCMK